VYSAFSSFDGLKSISGNSDDSKSKMNITKKKRKIKEQPKKVFRMQPDFI
jgi:hypothetical protein